MSYVPTQATHFYVDQYGHSIKIHWLTYTGKAIAPLNHHPVSELHEMFIADVVQQIKDKPLSERMQQHSKYHREIKPSVWVDVYHVLGAFTGGISERAKAAVDHAIKKLLAPGQRGVKSERQDLVEARDSLNRAIQLLDDWA